MAFTLLPKGRQNLYINRLYCSCCSPSLSRNHCFLMLLFDLLLHSWNWYWKTILVRVSGSPLDIFTHVSFREHNFQMVHGNNNNIPLWANISHRCQLIESFNNKLATYTPNETELDCCLKKNKKTTTLKYKENFFSIREQSQQNYSCKTKLVTFIAWRILLHTKRFGLLIFNLHLEDHMRLVVSSVLYTFWLH